VSEVASGTQIINSICPSMTVSAAESKVYNLFGASAERDIQRNIASPNFGQFFNPLETIDWIRARVGQGVSLLRA
jgi:hypothetical protein